MRRGLRSGSVEYEKPSLSSAPGRKFSVRTSLRSSSRSTSSRPSACLRSTAKLFLLRLNTGKKPAPACSRRRVLSPSSGSTLITSAPRSASASPQEGPITMCANSTTRTPSSSGTESFGNAGEGEMPVGLLLGQDLDHHLARHHQLVEVDASGDTHRFEHEHEILGDHVAARAGREWTAAEAAKRAIECPNAFFICGERVGEAKAARVVKMRAFQLAADGLLHSGKDAFHLRGIGIAHGVGQGDAVTELGERGGDANDIVLGYSALHRAAEGGGDGALDLDAGMRILGALAHFLDHLLGRHAHVRQAVLAARRDRERNLVRTRLERALKPLEVGCE